MYLTCTKDTYTRNKTYLIYKKDKVYPVVYSGKTTLIVFDGFKQKRKWSWAKKDRSNIDGADIEEIFDTEELLILRLKGRYYDSKIDI